MKKWLLSFLTVLCIVSLCSCGSTTEGDNATVAALEEEIAILQSRIAELEEENRTLKNENTNLVSDNKETPADDNSSPIAIQLNTPVSVGEVMDITITGAEWCDSVVPSDTSGGYSYYEDKDGETYFVVRGTITSYASTAFDIQWNSESAILINDKYSFSATMEFEDLDGQGFGGSIKPLQTCNFIIRSSVSDEVYNIGESVQVSFSLPDNEEQLEYFYDENHSNANYIITFSGLKTNNAS